MELVSISGSAEGPQQTAVMEAVVRIVDDDAAIRAAIGRLLSAQGHSVAAFASAEAFLEARDCDAPGCLVLDVELPDLDGLSLQRALAGRAGTRKRAPWQSAVPRGCRARFQPVVKRARCFEPGDFRCSVA